MAARKKNIDPKPNKPFGLGHEVLKAVILTIISGILGYAGGLIMPPGALYDRWRRQDPNNLAGVWVGAVGGWTATLELTELPRRQLKGILTVNFGQDMPRKIAVEGNRDSGVFLNGGWDATNVLKIGLVRKIGERFGPDDGFVLLVPNDPKVAASIICPRGSMNISKACSPIGDGTGYFSRDSVAAHGYR